MVVIRRSFSGVRYRWADRGDLMQPAPLTCTRLRRLITNPTKARASVLDTHGLSTSRPVPRNSVATNVTLVAFAAHTESAPKDMAGQVELKVVNTTKPTQNGHSYHEEDARSCALNLDELTPELQTNILKHVCSLFTRVTIMITEF